MTKPKGPRPCVVVESPLAGDVQRNIQYADRAMKDSLDRREAPFLSHLLYPRVLDDGNAQQRRIGLRAAQAWIPKADLVAVYADYGVSRGMQEAINIATAYGVNIEFRYLLKKG